MVCPEGVDPNEWIAVHSICPTLLKDECTTYSCPVMSAGKV